MRQDRPTLSTIIIAACLLLTACRPSPTVSPTSLPTATRLPSSPTSPPPAETSRPSETPAPSQTPAENQATPTAENAQIEPDNADRLEQVASLEQDGARLFTWLPDSTKIAVSTGQELTLINQQENSLIESASLPGADAAILVSAPKGNLIGWAAQDNSLHVWNLAQNRELFNLPSSEAAITSLVFSPDSRTLAVAAYDNGVRLLNANNGALMTTYTFDSWLSDLAFSPDNRLLAGVDLPNFLIHVWEIASGSETSKLEWAEHASPALYGAFFSPDWSQVAWVARGTVQLMVVDSGELGPTLEHEDFVNDVAWSPDGRLLASAAAGTLNGDFVPIVEMWDAAQGQSIKSLGQQAPVFGLEFSPNGLMLGALDGDGKLQLFAIPP